MIYTFKRAVTEWYSVEAESREEAEEFIYRGDEQVVNSDEGDLIFVEEEV